MRHVKSENDKGKKYEECKQVKEYCKRKAAKIITKVERLREVQH